MKTLTKVALTAGLALNVLGCGVLDRAEENLSRETRDFTTTCFVYNSLSKFWKSAHPAMDYKTSAFPDSARRYEVRLNYSVGEGMSREGNLTVTDESGRIVYKDARNFIDNTSTILSLSLSGEDVAGFGIDGLTRPNTYLERVQGFAGSMMNCNQLGNPNLEWVPAH